ncbi:MAG: winged helix-turn-helix domain-containing protein [Candidatus Hodarchaeales archaeon]
MSSKDGKVQRTERNDIVSTDFWVDIFTNKIRFRILQLLFVYGELSLTALSKHMHKSKPALYHHLQKMIGLGIVRVSREEHIRGSIKAKYYSLDEQVAMKIQLISEEELMRIDDPLKRLDTLKSIISTYRNSISLFRSKMDMLDLYADFLEERSRNNEESEPVDIDLQSLVIDYNVGFHAQYLTEKEYTKLMEYYQEFQSKVREILITQDSQKNQGRIKAEERPYFLITMILPLKKLLDLELKKMKGHY